MSDATVYFDYHSHAPLDPRVHVRLFEAYRELDCNPHAASLHGDMARRALASARSSVAELLGVYPSEIVFTSGATESNNIAIHGLMRHLCSIGRTRIVVSAGEHASVLAVAEQMRPTMGVVHAPLMPCGTVDLDALDKLITPSTGLVSIAAANHEIGVVQPLEMIAALGKVRGAFVHSDLAQVAGKLPVDLREVDLASVSAHKMSGPLGVGALFIRRSVQRLLTPIVFGGGQEGGLRPGSVPAPLCVAFGLAAKIAREVMSSEAFRVGQLRDHLLAGLEKAGDVTVNGRLDQRLPGNLNLSFEGVDAEALTMKLRGRVVVSTGSACSSHSLEPSHVLLAIGLDRAAAESSIRIGLGRFSTREEVEVAVDILCKAVAALRAVRRRLTA